MRSIGVFCGSNTGSGTAYAEAARKLADEIKEAYRHIRKLL